MLVLEQVSVINDLKGIKECMNKQLLLGKRSNNRKDSISDVKTPSSVSMVKISLMFSTTRLTGTEGMMMLTSSDPHDFIQLNLGLCQTLTQFYAVFSAQAPT